MIEDEDDAPCFSDLELAALGAALQGRSHVPVTIALGGQISPAVSAERLLSALPVAHRLVRLIGGAEPICFRQLFQRTAQRVGRKDGDALFEELVRRESSHPDARLEWLTYCKAAALVEPYANSRQAP